MKLLLKAFAFAALAVATSTVAAAAERPVTQLSGKWRWLRRQTEAQRSEYLLRARPTIVMLPGLGRGPIALEPWRGGYSICFRVVIPEARAIRRALDRLKVSRCTIWPRMRGSDRESGGWSTCNHCRTGIWHRVARMLAADRPDLVRGVILIAAGGKFPPRPEISKAFAIYEDKNLPDEVRSAAAKLALFSRRAILRQRTLCWTGFRQKLKRYK